MTVTVTIKPADLAASDADIRAPVRTLPQAAVPPSGLCHRTL